MESALIVYISVDSTNSKTKAAATAMTVTAEGGNSSKIVEDGLL
jgi:hypothetical protein